jgi:protein TonB
VSTADLRARRVAVATVAVSIALHGAAFAAAARVRPAPRRERIEIDVVSRRRPPPAPSPRSAPPVGEREKVRAAVAAARPVPAAPPPAAPPPALASAPAPAPAPRAIPRVGVSLGSTVASGGFAVAVGNTAYGKAAETAADPSSVRPYAGGVVPAARLSAQPRPLELPRIEYPAKARKDGIEGQVALLLRIDARGVVTAVRALDAPSPALAAAAVEGASRFRFTPALVEGEPVETEIRFTYTFLLE